MGIQAYNSHMGLAQEGSGPVSDVRVRDQGSLAQLGSSNTLNPAWAQAEGLSGQARSTHSFARVSVAGQVQLTGVRWATLHPQWSEEGLVFRRAPWRPPLLQYLLKAVGTGCCCGWPNSLQSKEAVIQRLVSVVL